MFREMSETIDSKPTTVTLSGVGATVGGADENVFTAVML